KNASHTPTHRSIPKLKMAVVLVLPIAVQIQQHIQAPIQPKLKVSIEIGMHGELPAGKNVVKAAAIEMGIGNNRLNAGDGLEVVHKRGRIQEMKQAARDRAHVTFVIASQLHLLKALEPDPGNVTLARKLGDNAIEDALGEETVDDNVVEGVC